MIAWVFDSEKTGIGRYTKSAIEILKKSLKIKPVCEERDFDKVFSSETVIYNMGNSRNSVKIYNLMKMKPGIVILHDRTYHNFFAYYYVEHLKRSDLYLDSLRILYGEDVAKEAERKLEKGELFWEGEASVLYPMVELIFPYSKAIVVHSEEFSEKIRNEFLGPVLYVPFPFRLKKRRQKFRTYHKRFIFLSYGFLGKNRMIDDVVEAIGKNKKIKDRIIYIIAGYMEDSLKDKIVQIIKRYSLEDNVKILGFVSERKLRKLLSECFLCINLRKFSSEVVSWSFFEQVDAEKPVVVSDTGFFKEIPDDLVFKVRSPEQLEEVFLKVLESPEEALSRAKKAKEYLRSILSEDSYRKRFRDFIKENSYNRTLFVTEVLKGCSEAAFSISEGFYKLILPFISEGLEIFFRG